MRHLLLLTASILLSLPAVALVPSRDSTYAPSWNARQGPNLGGAFSIEVFFEPIIEIPDSPFYDYSGGSSGGDGGGGGGGGSCGGCSGDNDANGGGSQGCGPSW